ncbi:MAG: GGDEF domain-containing protein [Planctomycetaceae bacterium]
MQTLHQFQLPETRVPEAPLRPGDDQSRESCLVRIYPPGLTGSLIPLREGRMSIGRDPLCDIELIDDFISRHHASIERDNDGFFLTDMTSLNGCFVNDLRIERQRLKPGDHLRLGNHILKFLSSNHVEAQYHEAVYQMMTSDGLTMAYNRRYFEDAFRREVLRSNRHCRSLALVLFDIDHFKKVNDQYGHLVGDECLRELCERIRRRVREDEIFARIGGEEFAVLLAESTQEGAIKFAEELMNRVSERPFASARGESVKMTISVGLAHCDGESPQTPDGLFEDADRRLYLAKRRGRNLIIGPDVALPPVNGIPQTDDSTILGD